MNPLLIATTNPAKLAEYRTILRGYDLKLLSLRDAGIDTQAPEDAATFADNARLKAHFYFNLAQIPTLADDGGLEVDALDGAPGTNSHRWLGPDADDRALAEAIVRRVAGLPAGRRTARLRAAAVLIYRSEGKSLNVSSKLRRKDSSPTAVTLKCVRASRTVPSSSCPIAGAIWPSSAMKRLRS